MYSRQPFEEASLGQSYHIEQYGQHHNPIHEMLKVHFGSYKPKQENSRRSLRQKWNDQYMPDHWHRHDFVEEGSGLSVPCMASHIQTPQAEICFILGYKAIPQAYERVANLWNALGYDVCFMMLPFTDRECDFVDAYDRSVHQFLCDNTLAIHQDSKPNIPKIIVTHSTAGLCLNRNQLNSQNNAQYTQNYAAIIHMAAFFGMAGANHVYGQKTYKRFQKYAADETLDWRTREMKKNPRLDLLSSETWAGKTYLQYLRYFKKDPDIFSSIDDPTLRQMRELTQACEEYHQAIQHADLPSIPTHYFIPEQDTVACPKLQHDIANQQKASITSIRCFHSLALENPFDGLLKVTEKIEHIQYHHRPMRPVPNKKQTP